MTEAVLDASVVLKWFRADGERHLDPARSLRATFESGQLAVAAPPLLRLELVNVAGRRWKWGEDALVELAIALDELGFEFEEPELSRVASWTARGLTAYDAAYVALAEARATPLITDDDLILSLARDVATALADTSAEGHAGLAQRRYGPAWPRTTLQKTGFCPPRASRGA